MKKVLLKRYNALLILISSLFGLSACEEPEPIVKPMYGVSPACLNKQEISIEEASPIKKPIQNEKDHHQ